jgi:membrane protein
MGLKDLWKKGKVLWSEFSVVKAGTYASSIAYFTFLSLIPLLAICISLVSIAGIDEQEVVGLLVAVVPDALKDLVRGLVNDAFSRSGIAFSLSTIVLLWSASKGVKALRGGLNAAFAVKESRSAPAVVAISIGTVIVLGVLIAAMMYIVFNKGVMSVVTSIVPGFQQSGLMNVLAPILVLAFGVLILDVCYSLLPAGTRRFSTQLPGAALATLACGVLSFGFRVYVDHFGDFTVLYGSIATVALLLMWIYFMSYIIIAGAFVNRLLSDSRGRGF